MIIDQTLMNSAEFLFCVLDVLLIFRLGQIFLQPKKLRSSIFWGITVLASVLMYFVTVTVYFSSFAAVLTGVLICVYTFAVFDGPFYTKLLSSLLYHLGTGLITILVVSTVVKVANVDLEVIMSNQVKIILTFVIKIVTVALFELARRIMIRHRDDHYVFASSFTMAYLIINIMITIVLFDIILRQNFVISKQWLFYFVIIQVVSVALMFIIIKNYFEARLSNHQYQVTIDALSENRERELKRAELDMEVAKLRHDMKNHFATLQYLLEKDRYPQAQEYLDEILSHEVLKTYVNTKNPIINGMINSKISSHPDIKFVTRIGIEAFDIKMYDLTVLLGNALDNAIEATSKREDDLCIKITIEESNQFCKIVIMNTFQDEPIVSGDGFISSKRDGVQPGIGIQSMRHIVKKYDGRVDITHDESWFKLIVLLNKISD